MTRGMNESMYVCLSVCLSVPRVCPSCPMRACVRARIIVDVSWDRASREARVVDVRLSDARERDRSVDRSRRDLSWRDYITLILKSVEHGDAGRAGDGDVCER